MDMVMRIGAGPLPAFEDDFSAFRNDIAREAHLAAVQRAGFEGICLNPGSPREIAAVRASLARHGLTFIAPTFAIDLTRRTATQVFVDLDLPLRVAQALGATELTVTEQSRAPLREVDWERFGERLGEIKTAVARSGVRLVYRPVKGTIVGSAETIERMLDAAPGIDLVLDVPLLGAAAAQDLALRHGARIALVVGGSDDLMATLPAYRGWIIREPASALVILEHLGRADSGETAVLADGPFLAQAA